MDLNYLFNKLLPNKKLFKILTLELVKLKTLCLIKFLVKIIEITKKAYEKLQVTLINSNELNISC